MLKDYSLIKCSLLVAIEMINKRPASWKIYRLLATNLCTCANSLFGAFNLDDLW